MKLIRAALVALTIIAGFVALDEQPAHGTQVVCAGAGAWQVVPPQGTTASLPTATWAINIAPTSWANARGIVVVRGTDNAVWRQTMWRNANTNTWHWSSAWTRIGGATLHTPKVYVANGTLYISVIGTDGNTYLTAVTNGEADGFLPFVAHSVGAGAYNAAPFNQGWNASPWMYAFQIGLYGGPGSPTAPIFWCTR